MEQSEFQEEVTGSLDAIWRALDKRNDQAHAHEELMVKMAGKRNHLLEGADDRAAEAHAAYMKGQAAQLRVFEKAQNGENVTDEEMPDLIFILAHYCQLCRGKDQLKDCFLAAQRILERIKMDPTYDECVVDKMDEKMEILIKEAALPWKLSDQEAADLTQAIMDEEAETQAEETSTE